MPAKRYRTWTPYQSYLMPPSPLEWLPQGHLAYFILEVVEALELGAIERALHRKDPRGERPYAPKMMVGLLLYAYCVGLYSSRKIAQATYDYVSFRVLAGGSHPHFTTINQFRLDHREALAGLFLEVLYLCQKAGLLTLGHVSLDGSKIQANASKHKAMSYGRMEKEEARLRAEIEAMLQQAEAADREEDERYGEGNDATDLPEELQRRDVRLRRIQEAKAELEQEAAEARAEKLRELAKEQENKADDPSVEPAERKRAATRAKQSKEQAEALEQRSDDDDEPPSSHGSSELPRHRARPDASGRPTSKAQRNFTDPDSRIMKNNRGFFQAYNAQIAVDGDSQVIVAEALTNQAPDQEHLAPMLRRIVENCGKPPTVLSADSGYFSAENVAACEHRNVDAYIATSRHEDAEPSGEPNAPMTASQRVKYAMQTKLQRETGKTIYARRKAIAEPPFGQIKEARSFRRFSLRSLAKARCEWKLVCLAHNLLKLFRASPRSMPQAPATAPVPA